MAFSSSVTNDIPAVGSGERFGSVNVNISFTDFEDSLKIGRFAKIDTGSIDNMDGSATPTIAGVVLRKVSRAVEDEGVVDTDLYSQIEVLRSGLVTVDVKDGESPSKLGRVYVSNDGDANDGLATATDTDVAVNAEFIHEVKDNVWLVYVNPPQGDVATHIGDSDGAHAASAISVADAGAYTSEDEVEGALQELYEQYKALVADPGDAAALENAKSASIALTTAAAETRTLADPAARGIQLTISADDVSSGDAVVTAATAINQTGNNTLTFDAAGETIFLESVTVGGALVWRVVGNDGVDLTTV